MKEKKFNGLLESVIEDVEMLNKNKEKVSNVSNLNNVDNKISNLIKEIKRFQNEDEQYEETEEIAKIILNENIYDYYVSYEEIIEAYIASDYDKWEAQKLTKELIDIYLIDTETEKRQNEMPLGFVLDYAYVKFGIAEKIFEKEITETCFEVNKEQLFELAEEQLAEKQFE